VAEQAEEMFRQELLAVIDFTWAFSPRSPFSRIKKTFETIKKPSPY